MTAVAVEYRPAMDSCMVGTRLCRTCALTAPDSSDSRVSGSMESIASAKVSKSYYIILV